jgi:hypothetical protein
MTMTTKATMGRAWRTMLAMICTLAAIGISCPARAATLTMMPYTIRLVATVNLSDLARQTGAAARTPQALEPSQRAQAATIVNRRIPIASQPDAAIADGRILAKVLRPPSAKSIAFASPQSPAIFGFNGLDALDTAIGNGLNVDAPATGFAIEPPDPALCVGNGKVVELTNLEFAVYEPTGKLLQGPLPLSGVFSVPSSDFLADPKCYYDTPTNSFYMTLTDLTDMTTHSSLQVAVMAANSVTINAYQIDTTDDGTGNTPPDDGCPCFGDQPLLGANGDALFLTTNEISFSNSDFNGVELYLISKSDLAAAVASPRVFSVTGGIPAAGGLASSIQPATSPNGQFITAHGGTEFMMSALDFAGTGDDRIAVWAITNTCIVATNPCTGNLLGFTLKPTILHTPTYMNPRPANQQAGAIPYGDATHNSLEQIDTNDDRMGQLVYAHGSLYAGLDTLVRVGGADQAGIEYFIVKPSFHTQASSSGPQLDLEASLQRSGYVAHSGTDISYPAIGVTTSGLAVMGFSLTGASIYPSAGWMPIAGAGANQIHFAADGGGPDDGYTGYPTDNSDHSSVARWGAYSSAVADRSDIWMATEYIRSSCTDAQYALDPLCGMTRAPDANWSTFISELATAACDMPSNPCPPGPGTSR